MQIYTAGTPRKQLSPSEALFGFGAWLTTREKPVTMGSNYECGIVAELIDKFCKTNELEEPREGWDDLLKHPKD